MKDTYGIHWFRRDLRIVGNPALEKNLKKHSGRVVGVFSFDRTFLARPDFSFGRFLFFLRTLENLRDEMRANGGDLLFLDAAPEKSFPALFESLGHTEFGMPTTISWNRDYEPFARVRDARMHELFERNFRLETLTERDHLFLEPTELAKDEKGGTYQVYTPFSNKWLKIFETPEMQDRLSEVTRGLKKESAKFLLDWKALLPSERKNVLEDWITETEKNLPAEWRDHLPSVGHSAAKTLLKKFKADAIADYDIGRDIPSISGTSKMSIYLKNGSITVPQIISILELHAKSLHLKYFKELIWREFYYHILYHHPNVEQDTFLEKYRKLGWQNNPEWFRRWCEGRTGYPIIDAGMRQLNTTGWMHNRLRMIVASFLTKDLLIDYRWGEKYFMEKLLDGDLAPNNGGWQWAASTGCDPQPYFRIFNPTSQSERFDPEGKYIMRWVPELAAKYRDASGKALQSIHEPVDPIVDHSTQRDLALAMFKAAREG